MGANENVSSDSSSNMKKVILHKTEQFTWLPKSFVYTILYSMWSKQQSYCYATIDIKCQLNNGKYEAAKDKLLPDFTIFIFVLQF